MEGFVPEGVQRFPHNMGLQGAGQTGTALGGWGQGCKGQSNLRLVAKQLLLLKFIAWKTLNLTGDSGQTRRGQEIKSLAFKGIHLSRSTGKPRNTELYK